MTKIIVMMDNNEWLKARHRDDLPHSRALLESKGMPVYLAGMINLDVLRWLEPYEVDVQPGLWWWNFDFQDTSAALLFKLTWL